MDFLYNILQSLGINDPGGTGWLAVAFTFLIAWGITYLFMPTVRSFALKVGWADQPNARRLNKEPLPNAGGLVIYAGVIAALVLALVIVSIFKPIRPDVLAQVLTILLGGSFLVLVGFIDDQFGLHPYIRLLAQVLAAILLAASKITISVNFGTPIDPIFSGLLTIFWVVAITNAINLMDGIDGLVGGISFITAMSLLAVSAQPAYYTWAAATFILAALGGAALGFLRHNFHPSRIIMGDAGAYFFGYVLAATSIIGKLKGNTVFALIPTVLFLLLPVLDTTQVFVRRLMAGKNPLKTPGKDHLHHRLLDLGLSQRHVVFVLWGISLVCNLVAISLKKDIKNPSMLILVTGIGIIGLLGFTIWRRTRALGREKPKVWSQKEN
ncbi:MAG: undecaprenyl/decaprenyl-phosphate alpha-N-acetylglucosaminyl 1-phosphate transferase [Cyanosarcina radialis HA8281-LM2]|jgi:UDP-GlcNAc:undecaprenyl-phosphate GlcNAc-1-phosphate transferase|nr:undecaprenyl/decaprenyl-phosphate alpha-N-acetylglucosaminyl 1-phosphate transferase [Cyanosarcina radialis HA8281-LM2]